MLQENCHLADVVYTRWINGDGKPFPFSPYSRVAHIQGLDFVGTDVCLSPTAVEAFNSEDYVHRALRYMASIGLTFHGVDAVTYRRN